MFLFQENAGCERFRLISGIDESALSCEMGLYFKFNVTEDGVPYGCPGFDMFKPEYWASPNGKFYERWSRVPKSDDIDTSNYNWKDYKTSDPLCELNDFRDDGDKPLHKIFEDYANDQNRWVKDFMPTLEKMLANGYTR